MKKDIIFLLFSFIIIMSLLMVGCSSAASSTPTPSTSGAASSTSTSVVPKTTAASATSATPTSSSPTVVTPNTTTTISSSTISSSNVSSDPTRYNGKTISVTGQIFLIGNQQEVLLDGMSGINITGDISNLETGYYTLTGTYAAATNTLNVIDSVAQNIKYKAISIAERLGVNLSPVSIGGLVATPPQSVAEQLSSYLNIPDLPHDLPIYPYVVYTQNGFYLVLSDQNVQLPAKFTFLYKGTDYSFTFCASEVSGTLVKTPLNKINFGTAWQATSFNGVIIADSIAPQAPVLATVKDIDANPTNYIFKRVSIAGSYITTTATVDYSDIKAPMGVGILADSFGDFFSDSNQTLETIDPNRHVWQMREGTVTGTVMYPTEQLLKFLDYAAPLSTTQAMNILKPALVVDTLQDDIVNVANISDLNPVTGNPSEYWGKVVEFEGYALGINYPLKNIAEAVTHENIPVNVNLLAVGIADKINVGSQLAIIGLNNDLLGENGEMIAGEYKFKVAVTKVPQQLVSGVPYADTAFFLLSKEPVAVTLPTAVPTLTPAPTPIPTTSPAPAPTLKSIAVTPENASIGKGKTQQFSAIGTYSDGSTKDISKIVVWTTSTPLVATVGPGGLTTGIAPGSATITATVGTVQSSATLSVTFP